MSRTLGERGAPDEESGWVGVSGRVKSEPINNERLVIIYDIVITNRKLHYYCTSSH